ncbi:MAG: F0F1 ATP synthase subunit epsilon [Muribaculaceae bacterium]
MILRVISAEATVFEGEVTSVTLPGEKGSFMVLQNHASIVSTLVKGKLAYVPANGEAEEQVIDGGIVDVDNNVVSVCIF